MATIFPVTLSLAARRLPVTGRVTGRFIVGGALGSMTLPWLMGRFFEPGRPGTLVLPLWIDLLAAAGVLVGLVV
jgi:hypothetical protein